MMEYPFISVIIPTYNRSAYLKELIGSIVNQDYPPECFELIMVDNGSTDNTRDNVCHLAKGFQGRINFKFIREGRPGLVFARHTGAAQASGDILLFGDDDAVFDRNWISVIWDVYRNYPQAGAVGTKIQIRWDHTPEPWVHCYEGVLGKLDYGEKVIIRSGLLYLNGGSYSIRKEILLRVKGFNPGQKGGYIIGDSETGLCRKLAQAGIPIGWTPYATVWHLQRAEENGNLKDLKRRFINNGISEAYYLTFYPCTSLQIIRDILEKTKRLLRKSLYNLRQYYGEYNIYLYYDTLLEMVYYLSYLKFIGLYRLRYGIHKEIANRDWEFTLDYKPSPVEFSFAFLKANGGIKDSREQ